MRFARWTSLLLISTASCGCSESGDTAGKHSEPASVAHHLEEQDLNKVTLSERAEQRLGIRLAEVQSRDVQQQRTFGGEVVVPPGRSIVVSAPIAGTLAAPEGEPVPVPGSKLAAAQPVFQFKPLLTPERDVLTPAEKIRVAQTKADIASAQIEAERQMESTRLQVEAADIAYTRAAVLLKNKAGSQRSVDEADAQLKLAHKAQAAAEARHKFFSEIRLDVEAGEPAVRTIESPVAGILQSLDAVAGETVAAGDLLFQVVTTSRVWIRVPVYVGYWREIDNSKNAVVAEYGQPADTAGRSAKYVSAPPSANPLATSVDLFYELSNDKGHLYPGQKLAVTVPIKSNAESLVVPFHAVLYDIYGGAWVYQQLQPHTFARRRVSVKYVDGSDAVLAAGPEPGAKVVTDGAAELFGTEFGVGH